MLHSSPSTATIVCAWSMTQASKCWKGPIPAASTTRQAELGLDGLLAAPDESIRALGATQERWLLRKASFRQDGAPHILLVLADVSVPLQEEERAAWGRLIRVLGHELSNSLAPIKSIAGSLRARVDTLQGSGPTSTDFHRGLGIIESRADSLHRFVQSYRMLAQLPPPRLQAFSLGPLVERVALLDQRVWLSDWNLTPQSSSAPMRINWNRC